MTLELLAGEANPLARSVVVGAYRGVSYHGVGCGACGGPAQVELNLGEAGNRWVVVRHLGGHAWRWHMRREIETRIDDLALKWVGT